MAERGELKEKQVSLNCPGAEEDFQVCLPSVSKAGADSSGGGQSATFETGTTSNYIPDENISVVTRKIPSPGARRKLWTQITFVIALAPIVVSLLAILTVLIAEPSAMPVLKMNLHSLSGDTDAEISDISEALNIKDDAYLRVRRGKVYFEDFRISDAKLDFQRAVELGSRDLDAYTYLVNCRILEGHNDQTTIKLLNQALGYSNMEHAHQSDIAFLLLVCGDYQGALAAATDQDECARAVALERTGKIQQAGESFDKAALKGEHQSLCQRALYRLANSELAKARADIAKARTLHADCPFADLVDGWCALSTNDLNKAFIASSSTSKHMADYGNWIYPLSLRAANHKLRAEIYLKQGKMAEYEREIAAFILIE